MAKHKEYSIARNCYYILLSVFLVFILGILILYFPKMQEIDFAILDFIKKLFNVYPTAVPIFVSTFGMTGFWLWPRITLSAVLVSHGYYIKTIFFILYSQLMFWLQTNYVKPWIARERPCGSLYDGFSFPSTHTMFAMFYFGIIIYLANRYVKSNSWRIFLITISVLWIILMGISRMWLNHHFLTDVLAGYLLGFAFVNLFIISVKLVED